MYYMHYYMEIVQFSLSWDELRFGKVSY